MASKKRDDFGKTIFPAGLLLEDSPCLVVGGGRVGAAKLLNLLEAGARVTVLCPELGEEAARLVGERKARHLRKVFAPGDTEGFSLVYAATSDREVNREILRECRAAGRLVCAVDGNWPEGSFVTPAVIRRGNITVSVSSGGRSCRRSKLVKENIARHLQALETADLLVFGVSHRELSLEKRESLHFDAQGTEAVERRLSRIWGIHEFLLLTTCNRTELWAVAGPDPAIRDLLPGILGMEGLSETEGYLKTGFPAFHHSALLSAGLFSQTPGENHIVAQIKDALAGAVRRGSAGPVMQDWVSRALHVSKHIRSASLPILKGFEIEDLVFDYAREALGGLPEEALVVGAGEIGRAVALAAEKRGLSCLWCYHRSPPDPQALGLRRTRLLPFSGMAGAAAAADLAVFATASREPILGEEHAALFEKGGENACGVRGLILDLSLPRNVDPALKKLVPGLLTADLDDLKHWYRRRLADMDATLGLADAIVGEHEDDYVRIIESFQGGNPGQ